METKNEASDMLRFIENDLEGVLLKMMHGSADGKERVFKIASKLSDVLMRVALAGVRVEAENLNIELPDTDPDPHSPEAIERYVSDLERAVFDLTGLTRKG